MGALAEAIESGARLVTILGAGGMGKTTLVRTWLDRRAAGSLGLDAERVIFADLTEAHDRDDLRSAVLDAVGVHSTATRDRGDRDVIDTLRDRSPCVVVLDNFEQLVESAAALVERWVRALEDVTWIVTSRQLLRIPSETALELGPLSVDGQERGHSAAYALFVDRARRVRKGYASAPGDDALVERIVRGLEGVPLAIELAAARANLFPLPDLANRIHDVLGLLVKGPIDGAGRRRGLREVIDWSYRLLDGPSREAFAQCAVFRGGCRVEQAQDVLAPSQPGAGAIELLQSLRDHCLLFADTSDGGDGRLRMLVTVQSYAQEKLLESGAWSAALRRHADVFISMAEQRLPPEEPQIRTCPGELATEEENVAAAVDGLLSLESPTETDRITAVRGASALLRMTFGRGGFRRARTLLHRVAPFSSQCPLDVRVSFAYARAHAAVSTLDPETLPLALLAEQTAREGARESFVAAALRIRAVRHHQEGDLARARLLHEEALSLASRPGASFIRKKTRASLALLRLEEGDIDGARAALAEIEDRHGGGLTEVFHALCDLDAGRPADAKARLADAANEDASFGDEGSRLGYLGLVERELGEYDAARAHLDRATSLCREGGYSLMGAYLSACLAGLGAQLGNIEEAREVCRVAVEELAPVALLQLACKLEAAHVEVVSARLAGREPDAARALLAEVAAKGHVPNVDVRISYRALARILHTPADRADEPLLAVASDGSSYRLHGSTARCDSAAGRKILVALANAAIAGAQGVPSNALIAKAWPGERIQPLAAKNRLYVAITTLRKTGLSAMVEKHADGYRLAPTARVELGP